MMCLCWLLGSWSIDGPGDRFLAESPTQRMLALHFTRNDKVSIAMLSIR
jgi:hypothetical protein